VESLQSKGARDCDYDSRSSQLTDSPSVAAVQLEIASTVEINTNTSLPEYHSRIQNNQLTEFPTECVTLSSPLTTNELQPKIRLHKPDELGTIGQQIKVMVNYFLVLQFPQEGFVYEYHIQMRNKRDFEISRQNQR